MSEIDGLGVEGGKARSPTYPYISLDLAIERAKKIFSQVKDHAQTREVMARVYGKPVTSSATIQTFATLQQYGLIEAVGPGLLKRLKVSTPTIILSNPYAPEKDIAQAKRHCALHPKIFRELWGRFETADLHDDVILYYLTREREAETGGAVFTEKAAREVLRVYRATLAYAGLASSDKSEPVELGENGDDSQGEEVASVTAPASTPEPTAPAVARPQKTERAMVLTSDERVLQTGMLSPTSEYRVLVTGKVGVKEIEWLIKKLEMDKEILATKPDSLEN